MEESDLGKLEEESIEIEALPIILEEESVSEEAEPLQIEFVEFDRVVSLIESLLFVSERPVSLNTIKQLFKGTSVKTSEILRALDQLGMDFASPMRGVALEEVQGGYQLRTKLDNADFLRKLAKTKPFRLSGPSLEVLSIVAYKQPIIKSEVDQIRGVESGHLLRALMEKGILTFNGKSDLPGKPMQYGTTRKFLELFGLRNLKELPTLAEIENLLPDGIGEEFEEKQTLADITSSLSQEVSGTYSEGEEELIKISSELQGINASSEFFEQEKRREKERRDRERAQDIRDALALGDPVEDKDRRWLERYEMNLLAQTAQPARDDTPVVDAEAPASDAEQQGC